MSTLELLLEQRTLLLGVRDLYRARRQQDLSRYEELLDDYILVKWEEMIRDVDKQISEQVKKQAA